VWFCINVSLKAASSAPKDHGVFMWPASCRGFCSPQGDNICTYMEETELECTARPCVTELGMETELGDHSLTGHCWGGCMAGW
jgi:Zn-dependent alcohol dehydrogenase